jgi:cytochrome bd ubiquinol oxidase subunit II
MATLRRRLLERRMVELWYALLCFMLIIFVVLDGWDIGAGVLHLIVARTEAERREVIAAIGPLWSWHEVWLVAAGGTFILAFPKIMAAAFSGFYLALWMVLWSFILRGISIEVGGHIHDRMWQAGWDVVFAVSNVLLAVLFGAALGNVIRGVPLDAAGAFSMALFTDFSARGQVGILDWFTLSVAVFATLLLAAHGATYLRYKTQGTVHDRSAAWARRLWSLTAILFVGITVQTSVVRPELFHAMAERPLAWPALLLVAGGFWALGTGLRGSNELRAFAGSCAVIAGLLSAAAVGMFPVILHSTLGAEHSLTAYAGAAPGRGLAVALIWWPVAFVLAATYFIVIMRSYRGKVRPVDNSQGFY